MNAEAAAAAGQPDIVLALEVVLALAVVVGLVVTVARKLDLPYPILLVVAGLGLGLIDGFPKVELEPELVLVAILPPLLFAAAWQTPIRDFRANRRPIVLLSVGLVVFTAVVVGMALQWADPAIPFAAALALGAIVAPPDAIAATSILRKLTVPRRVVTVLEGESLVNDATALTAFRVAVAAVAAGGVIVLGDAVLQFGWALAGGIVIGLGIGLAVSWIWSKLFDPPVEVLLSLLIPYAAYLVAEQVHASGVIATVAAGLVLGRRSSRILDADTRVLAAGVWQMVVFLLNGFAFLLLGLQLPGIVSRLTAYSTQELAFLATVVTLAVIVSRFVWMFPAVYVPRWVSPSLRKNDPSPPVGAVVVLAWAGMRGAVSLAAALSLPLDFPDRDLLLFLTFVVILVTLVGQGLTLPWVLRRANLKSDGAEEQEQLTARNASNDAALKALDRALLRWPAHRPLIVNLEQSFRHRAEHLADRDDPETDSEVERLEHLAILRSVVDAQREAVIRLRDDGAINDEVLREIERELDLEELRLESEA